MPAYTFHEIDPRTRFNDYGKSPHEFFALVWNNLRLRSTSQPDDVLGILAVLLDLKPSEILAFPGEKRMKAILGAQPSLPLSLLYNSGPRTPDEPGRPQWTPSADVK